MGMVVQDSLILTKKLLILTEKIQKLNMTNKWQYKEETFVMKYSHIIWFIISIVQKAGGHTWLEDYKH